MSANILCWTDIPVTNLDCAITFYSATLGREVRKISEAGFEYGLLPHGEQSSSGCLCVGAKPSQTGPLIYLSVEGRLDNALKAVRSNGGKVSEDKYQIGPHGFRSTCSPPRKKPKICRPRNSGPTSDYWRGA